MNITYSERVKQWGEGYPLIQRATNRLEEILGADAAAVIGEWDRTEDENGHTLATLRLRDATGEAVGKLAPDELQSPALTSFRLRRIWGDLLRTQTEKLFKALTGTGD